MELHRITVFIMKSVVFVAQSLIFYRIYLDVYGAEGETRTNLYKPHYKGF